MTAPASASASTPSLFEAERLASIKKMLIERVGYSLEALQTVRGTLKKQIENSESTHEENDLEVRHEWLSLALKSKDPILFAMYSGASRNILSIILRCNPSKESIDTVWKYNPLGIIGNTDYSKSLLHLDVAKEMLQKCPEDYKKHLKMVKLILNYPARKDNPLLKDLEDTYPEAFIGL